MLRVQRSGRVRRRGRGDRAVCGGYGRCRRARGRRAGVRGAAAGHDTGVPGPWYGFQTLAVDGAALVAAGAVAASTDVEPDPLNVLAATA